MTVEAEGPIWEEPLRGDYPDPRLLALPGLEVMRAFHDGRVLPPNIHHLVGLSFDAVERGRAVFTMPATGWLLAPQGVVAGSTLALLVDGPLGCAGQSMMPAATPYTTAEMSLSFIRPVTAESGVLTATGTCVHAGRTVVLTEVDVTDATGARVARGGSRLICLPALPIPPEVLEDLHANPPRPAVREWDTPPPWQRPARGQTLPRETWDRLGGLDVLRGCIDGSLPAPPVTHLIGIRPLSAEEGSCTWTMPASEWSSAPVPGRMYGGAIAYFAGNTVEGAIMTTIPAGAAMATVDLKVYFLRPVVPDGRPLTSSGTVVHRGRSVAVATAEVRDADGRLAALATGSAMVLPGRPARLASPEDRAEG
ncbi:MAG TPA: PaaI family thioesterase [Candidatus Dormibacteraeota bacterium]|jgi:uncharacterized protein (TIGR00369 family)|nr:PaaI family thioesterase [Candidatus Dormibacteraeota bacterium]